jgi:protein-tyrosine-phosphatase
VSPKAVEAMKELVYDLTARASKGLDDFKGTEVDIAVTKGCGDECPLVRAKQRVDWQIPDWRGMTPNGFRRVRGLIEAKVKQLVSIV